MIGVPITDRYLDKHRNLQIELADEKERWELQEQGNIAPPNLSGMPTAGGFTGDPTSRDAINNMSLEKFLNGLDKQVEEEEAYIESYLNMLTLPKQKQVIRLRYINHLEWSDVLKIMFGKKSDFYLKEDTYKRRMFGIRRAAIDSLYKMTEHIGSDK